MAREDERIVAITAAMKEGTGLACFAKEFPDRFFDVGISEQHAVTFAAGLAREGMRPYVAIYSTFLQRGFDQVIHDVALQDLPVRFILDRAGIVGEDGPTHHGTFDIGYMSMVPGMVVMAPADECEMKRMLHTMDGLDTGPSAMRFPRGSAEGVDAGSCDSPLEIGKGRLLREGGDAVLVSVGTMAGAVMDAASRLSEKGVEAAVIDARFIKPPDGDMISRVASGGAPVYVIEENSVYGGFGDAVSRLLVESGSDSRVVRIGIGDKFVPHGDRDELLEEEGLTGKSIAGKVLSSIEAYEGGSR
jgi:1-deoxy-D-xylulose-5-phosphate synthase